MHISVLNRALWPVGYGTGAFLDLLIRSIQWSLYTGFTDCNQWQSASNPGKLTILLRYIKCYVNKKQNPPSEQLVPGVIKQKCFISSSIISCQHLCQQLCFEYQHIMAKTNIDYSLWSTFIQTHKFTFTHTFFQSYLIFKTLHIISGYENLFCS